MAEIKSAIELAMERTKGLRLSHDEKEKLKEEEIQTRARGLVNRYLEVDFHPRDIERELARFEPPQREQLKALFLQYLTEAIDLDRENDLVFQGIESFRGGTRDSIEKIKKLIERYKEKKRREHQKVEKDLLAGLERQGVGGSAVQPAVEGSPAWEKALAGIRPEFEKELNQLRKDLE